MRERAYRGVRVEGEPDAVARQHAAGDPRDGRAESAAGVEDARPWVCWWDMVGLRRERVRHGDEDGTRGREKGAGRRDESCVEGALRALGAALRALGGTLARHERKSRLKR